MSDPNLPDLSPCVFKVAVKNRVVKRFPEKPITGQQGRWYFEEMLVVTEDEKNIEKIVRDHIEKRPIIGKPKFKALQCRRVVKITTIKKIM